MYAIKHKNWLLSALGLIPHMELYEVVGIPKPTKFLMPEKNGVIYFLGLCSLKVMRKIFRCNNFTNNFTRAMFDYQIS